MPRQETAAVAREGRVASSEVQCNVPSQEASVCSEKQDGAGVVGDDDAAAHDALLLAEREQELHEVLPLLLTNTNVKSYEHYKRRRLQPRRAVVVALDHVPTTTGSPHISVVCYVKSHVAAVSTTAARSLLTA